MILSPRNLIVALVISLTLISFLGCANVQHQATFNKNYLPKEDVRIKLAKVVNDTGYSFDVDIEQMLTNTLEEQLMEENLLNFGKTEPNLFMESRIVGYRKGSAFKRWMMPGWGATELAIRCDLKDDKNNLVGTAMASREVVAGGLYTVGAWETIFNDVANDVAEDLKDQIVAQGYVVKPKTRAQATSGSKDIEPSAQANEQIQEASKLASIPKDESIVRVQLRRQPKAIRDQLEIRRILAKYNFFEISLNTHGSFTNDLIDNKDGTVTDKATSLMWQMGGSLERLDKRGGDKYIKQLNSKHFAGYSDWRMPTIEELASLLARNRNKGVHLAPAFEDHQTSCWSADKIDRTGSSYLGTWIVDFKQATILQAHYKKTGGGRYRKNTINYVKAVRTVK